MCAHVWTRDQVNNCGIDGGLALPESSPVLSIISGTSVCLHLTPLHFGAVTGTPTILVITPLQHESFGLDFAACFLEQFLIL